MTEFFLRILPSLFAGILYFPSRNCGKIFFPPRLVCNSCSSREFEDTKLSDEGIVKTFTIIRVAPTNFVDEVPYAIGIIDKIVLGSQNQIKVMRENSIIFELFLFGCILIMGFYHLSLFIK